MSIEVKGATEGPRHHFFGFHDLVQWNVKGDLMLGLEIDDISHPPLPGEKARSGIIFPDKREFMAIHDTCAFNYPQGARQQWIGESDLFLCNDRVGDDWGCRISDARGKKVVESLPFPVHCHNAGTGDAYYISYSRLRMVGGYGYAGIADPYADEDIPDQCGIYTGNIKTSEHGLVVSIREIASCGEAKPRMTGFPHYVTHPVLNPSKTRLAFLHRYRVEDGGETTRLMTVGADGSGLRALAKGFLSHFDWLDDETLLIWGRNEKMISSMRELSLFRMPFARQGLQLAKKVFRMWKRKKKSKNDGQYMSFLRITDSDDPRIAPAGVGVLTQDGHPMVCPADRDWIVNDTYPDDRGVRTLMLYNHRQNRRLDIGSFRMIDARPSPRSFDAGLAFDGIAPEILKRFPTDQHLFSRSGYHCDLHPRWKPDGTGIAFDSIHEGSRQIYTVKVELWDA